MLGFRCLGKIQRGILAVADCIQASFGFPACRKRAVEVDFSGGAVSSNGGVLLLRAADRRLGLSAAAGAQEASSDDPYKFILAKIAADEGRFDDALARLDKLAQKNPENGVLRFERR